MPGIADILHRQQQVGLDTAVFIYHIEGSARYSATAEAIFRDLAIGSFRGVTSILTLMELVVKPLQLGEVGVADDYESLLADYPNLTIADLDRQTVRRAAELRAKHRLRPIDTLQVAACLEHGATVFVTNDRDFRRVTEIQVLLLEDFVNG